jgi:hypothetical protein
VQLLKLTLRLPPTCLAISTLPDTVGQVGLFKWRECQRYIRRNKIPAWVWMVTTVLEYQTLCMCRVVGLFPLSYMGVSQRLPSCLKGARVPVLYILCVHVFTLNETTIDCLWAITACFSPSMKSRTSLHCKRKLGRQPRVFYYVRRQDSLATADFLVPCRMAQQCGQSAALAPGVKASVECHYESFFISAYNESHIIRPSALHFL